jgi:hypothetical protein
MQIKNYSIKEINGEIKHGDMPGDIVKINDEHIKKANVIFPILVQEINKLSQDKIVISVFGGSGVGKSEISSVLAFYLNSNGINTYIMSGDNYPYRIPVYNDAERVSIFRSNGLKALVKENLYNAKIEETLSYLWTNECDSDPKLIETYPFLEIYQSGGRTALKEYLGTSLEQDYDQVNEIISSFKDGKESIFLKRMGRTEDQRYYDLIDFSKTNVLIIEWTHGGNKNIKGIDIPILLNSTPEETKEHRKNRARDGKVDSAFTTMVLEIEQEELDDRKSYAKIVISKKGEILK